MRSGAKVCKSCRSRQELSNDYLLAKIRFDTAENEPLKVCQKIRQKLKKVRTIIGPPPPSLPRGEAAQAAEPPRAVP